MQGRRVEFVDAIDVLVKVRGSHVIPGDHGIGRGL